MRSADPAGTPVALVSGANRGTGLAIARELHDRGYRVAALNRTLRHEEWLDEFPCDLADPDAVDGAVGAVLARFGRIDVCVTNAVDRVFAPVAEMDPADWDRSLAVNLTSVFRIVRASLPAVRAAGGLYVILGSHAGTRFFEGGASYSATKAALKALVETVLLEERVHGVRATLVSPGAIANEDGDDTPYKMATGSVARCVGALVQDQPSDLVIGDIELRPAQLPDPEISGIARLQHV
ncbi:SDR family oxidoreductase [Streptomyces clavuligerus]|uniref:Short-chain dehydrogenase/reductase SDR n=1 Tax=Streptomyces clavuligerus TaxID=1901 RepID=B5GV75_STRCL|nr:SDR family NAD(P)-dependent oxidoreductase [Streptomyces clavuligerus]ANW20142.1 short-chain dehydrogenase [Streptomyces clavuligerus]AXU14769.1 SDR family NAD(P)-dependent oxidoreductase [Streptomyces clavuligerus]EDY50221.1 short-chain dehydrogenase/reductase SDR [Streptomyces clavuligerus]EFG06948.1 Short-chain dehydrogenase/reductase SDR [Streptomyces clavuligerus]MBY6304797.1 SDR family NAD(P)-dependent oxidoreductase [Streptomyces clavuligerus]